MKRRVNIFKLVILLPCLLMYCGMAKLSVSTKYYVDINGDDSNNGTSPLTAWKTIRKVNSFRFQPGDQILFKCGGVWNEQLTPSTSGTSANPVVFDKYGTGDLPLITGFVKLSSWRALSAGIWQSDCPACDIAVNAVLKDGVVQAMGRYPNSDAPNKGYLSIDDHSGNSSITSAGLNGFTDWTGAELVIRKNHWIIDRSLITSTQGTTINYKSESKYSPVNKYGFFIQNDPKTLDRVGEWFFNVSQKKMLMFFGKENPQTENIKVSVKPVLLNIIKKSNIVINNIAFEGGGVNTIFMNSANNIKFDNITVNFSGVNAIVAVSTDTLSISNSTIKNTNNDAILCSYLCGHIVLTNNYIANTGIIAGMGQNGDGTYTAINIRGQGNVIANNKIDSTGYVPIEFQGDAIVNNNVINYYVFVKDDGGGIHTGDTNNSIQLKNTRQINGNFIFNGLGAREGAETDRYLTSSNAPWTAHGIYLDDNTKNVLVSGNTVANNNGAGIFLHNAHEITVTGNTLYNNEEQLLMSYDQSITADLEKTNKILNNIMVSGGRSKFIADFRSTTNSADISHLASFDSNYYINNKNIKEFYTYSRSINSLVSTIVDPSKWRSTSNSGIGFKKMTCANNILQYNSTSKPKTIVLNDNYVDINNKAYSGKVTLQPFSSLILIKK